MPPGKMAAQAGHAFVEAFVDAHTRDPPSIHAYMADGLGTKVVLVAPTVETLLHAYEAAKQSGLPCALIEDSGHVLLPHFDGSPVITAVGIGPATREQIRHITRHFPLAR